jgi:hypothetical protein
VEEGERVIRLVEGQVGALKVRMVLYMMEVEVDMVVHSQAVDFLEVHWDKVETINIIMVEVEEVVTTVVEEVTITMVVEVGRRGVVSTCLLTRGVRALDMATSQSLMFRSIPTSSTTLSQNLCRLSWFPMELHCCI